MFGSSLIEKLLNDTNLRVKEKEGHFEIVSLVEEPLFHVHKETFSIHLVLDIVEFVSNYEETICCELLCTYMKLNYLVQHGFLKRFLDTNPSNNEELNLKKVHNCLSFFEELKGEKKANLSEHQLNVINIYHKKMQESFIRL